MNLKSALLYGIKKINEKFCCYYYDSENIFRGNDTTTFNRNTVEFNHSVYIASDFFSRWDRISLDDLPSQLTMLPDEDNDRKTVNKLRRFVQDFIEKKLNQYMSGRADNEIKKMIEERRTFPAFPDDEYGKIRKDDLIRVAKELYCLEPRIFYKLKDIQEKSLLAFLNLLLGSEERENILTVVEQIVNLTSEQRKQFSDILQKTKLENIIDTINFIEKRYKVIELLKSIIYDLSKYANERDHVQKIIENNYWLFGEQYNLVSADQTMYRALEKYSYILYGAKGPLEKLEDTEEANRRMDIFLCGARKVENSYGGFLEENIIVELKAPNIVLSKKILRQIEDYMDIIREKTPFNSDEHRRWKFIAVCKNVDDNVKSQYETFKDRGKLCLVNVKKNYEVYAYTWDDVFTSFDLRHSFLLDKLKYDRSVLSEEIANLHMEKSRETVDKLTDMAAAN